MFQSKFVIIIKYLILLGTIAIALNMLFGQNTIIFVEKQLVPGTSLIWYKYDFSKYFQYLSTNIRDTTVLQLNIPRNDFSSVINGLITIVNYVIFLNNILLYPMKIGGYVMRFLLALIGINMNPESGLYWLGVLAAALTHVEIPLIPYQ